VKLTYLGTELAKLTINELLEMLTIPNLNPVNMNEINLELLKRLPPKPNLSGLVLF